MRRTSNTSITASTIPRAAIQTAYRDWVAICRAGLESEFRNEYQSLVLSCDWATGCDPLANADRDLLAGDLAKLLGEDRERVRGIVREMYVDDRVGMVLELLHRYAMQAREGAAA